MDCIVGYKSLMGRDIVKYQISLPITEELILQRRISICVHPIVLHSRGYCK